MMKKYILIIIGFCFSCKNNKSEVDTEKPQINRENYDSFPNPCHELRRGESFTVKALFTDNKGLGSYRINIHNNFDHHSHSTEIERECEYDPIKKAINPWLFNTSEELPSGKTRYELYKSIKIPEDIDTGDYHFSIYLTDIEGWEAIYIISLKVEK